jgi:hypothetical protein
MGRLIHLARTPFQYETRGVGGPATTGELFVEGERFNVDRVYLNPAIDPATIPRRIFAPSVPFDPYSMENQILAARAFAGMNFATSGSALNAAQALAANPRDAQAILKNAATAPPGAAALNPASNFVYETMAAAAYRDMQIASRYQEIAQDGRSVQQRLARDVQTVETINTRLRALNDRVLPVLKRITGQDLGAEPETWQTWWTDQLGYVYQSNIPAIKPTFTDIVSPFTLGTSHTACFAAGTMVVTLDGPRAIETVQIGDRVLSQDPTTGMLTFQPVVAVHHNRPSTTLRLSLDGETIVATGIHRFWKASKGWTMVRDLKPGDRIRTIGGIARVQSVEDDTTQPVYNLDVAENRDFFVGTRGFLVHDFSFVQPVLAPFDQLAIHHE